MLQPNTLPVQKRTGVNKLILGFAGLAATAIIGTTGLVAAQQTDKPSKAECAAAGFKNYGQCVKEWAHHKHHGGGYGGGYGGHHNNANINLNLSLDHSNNNIIHVIINFFR